MSYSRWWAGRVLAWDRFLSMVLREDEACLALPKFSRMECQRRWDHPGKHIVMTPKVLLIWPRYRPPA